jgi:glycosyltransferase involved in cell wall biosynthesis
VNPIHVFNPMLRNQDRPVKLAYVTPYDAGDVTKWSGLGYYICSALEAQGLAIERVGSLNNLRFPWAKAQQVFCWRVLGRQHVRGREPGQLRNYARQVAARLREIAPDVVFSPGSIPIAQLDCKQPIVIWTDATFASLVDFYPGFQRLCRHTLRDGHAMEQAALDRCSLVIYSSEWAAESALKDYRVSPAKVKVVPFGANLECKRTRTEVSALVAARPRDRCKLLFVGVDWKRKGGDLAVATAERLNSGGVAAELIVMGCVPSGPVPSYVRVVPYVNKGTAEGAALLDNTFAEAHFLLLPSVAECCAVVLAEACAFGVPSVVADVGGVRTAVRDGVNGAVFAREKFVDQATTYICELFRNPAGYRQLAAGAFAEFERRLNWRVAGAAVANLVHQVCGNAPAAG